jgi:CRP/FNR family nitrogen fixation transcriptional regulator
MQLSSAPIPVRARPPGFAIPPTIAESVRPQPCLATLEADAATITLGKDATIYGQDDAAQHCFRIVSGCVRTVKLMEDGRRHVGAFRLAGDWVGLDAAVAHAFAAEATVAATLRRYPRRDLDALAAADGRVARWLLDLATAELRGAREHAFAVSRNTAAERIARFLIEMTRRLPRQPDGGVILPMGRGDIADHLGVTLETVCRGLARFRRDGVIGLRGARLSVRSRAALAALAGTPCT